MWSRIGPVPLTPIWREGLLGLELASLLRHPLFTRRAARRPRPAPVMLIPGFLTGDAQMATLGSWLRRCGHRTHRSGIRLNVDCSAAATGRLEQRLEDFVRREGEPAVADRAEPRRPVRARARRSGGRTWCAPS